jgi:hypothetical protein
MKDQESNRAKVRSTRSPLIVPHFYTVSNYPRGANLQVLEMYRKVLGTCFYQEAVTNQILICRSEKMAISNRFIDSFTEKMGNMKKKLGFLVM